MNWKLIMGIALFLLVTNPAFGATILERQVRALTPGYHYGVVVRVVDGDTVRVLIPVWKNTPVKNVSLRIYGIDTPESLTINAKCPQELELGLKAKAFAETLVKPGDRVRFYYLGHDKYFRLDARVELKGGLDWANQMLNAKLAKPYSGGTKPDWCTP